MGASEALPSITAVSQLHMGNLQKNGRRKLKNKNRWKKKEKRKTRKGRGNRNCFLIFFISHNKWLRKNGMQKGKIMQLMGVKEMT